MTIRSGSRSAAWRSASWRAGGLDDVPAAERQQVGDPPAALGLVVDDQGGQHRNDPVRADSVNQP